MKQSTQEQHLTRLMLRHEPTVLIMALVASSGYTDQCPACGKDIPAGKKECQSTQCCADQGDQWWDDLPNRPWNAN